jgi:hypothetical protein
MAEACNSGAALVAFSFQIAPLERFALRDTSKGFKFAEFEPEYGRYRLSRPPSVFRKSGNRFSGSKTRPQDQLVIYSAPTP